MCCPYELGATAQENIQNFFLLFELNLNGFTLPAFVGHPVELEASLKSRNKSLNILKYLVKGCCCD